MEDDINCSFSGEVKFNSFKTQMQGVQHEFGQEKNSVCNPFGFEFLCQLREGGYDSGDPIRLFMSNFDNLYKSIIGSLSIDMGKSVI